MRVNCLEDVHYISVLKHDFNSNMGEVLPSIMHDGVVVIRGIQIICVLLLKVVCRCCARANEGSLVLMFSLR